MLTNPLFLEDTTRLLISTYQSPKVAGATLDVYQPWQILSLLMESRQWDTSCLTNTPLASPVNFRNRTEQHSTTRNPNSDTVKQILIVQRVLENNASVNTSLLSKKK